jgi:menaquinone-9 beta-reductase
LHTTFDIIIVGAGPAGTTCALALRDSGLRVVLIDKQIFPRDKTCGDAIPGASFKTLQKVLPSAIEAWEKHNGKQSITQSHIVTAKGKTISMPWSGKAYNCTRESWDDFLMLQVKKHTDTTILEGQTIATIQQKNNEVIVTFQNQETITAKIIIGCDGAYSIVKKYLFTHKKEAEQAVAVRAYYKNMSLPNDANYFYINNLVAQSYLWIFPVQNNLYNVGFGIIPSARTTKVDVKKTFATLLATDNNIKHLFTTAEAITKVEGFKLPLYTKQIPISTSNCMLCGDAASLIDPIQGHGIDKAMESGRLAALQAMQCFATNNFDANSMLQYDKNIYDGIGKELHRNTKILKIMTRIPWVLDVVAKVGNWKVVKGWLRRLT